MVDPEDLALDAMAILGGRRCVNARAIEASILIPDPHEWTKNRDTLTAQQLEAFGGAEKLLESYMELLARSQTLVDYCAANLGTTEDWPIRIYGESSDSEEMLLRMLNKLSKAVGCLLEI
jgi:hypothetical protein